jgi:hypothetical protein
VDREELARVFYGEGAVPEVWATDCPVKFDAWLAFAQPAAGPDGRVDLILAVNEEHGTRRVLEHWASLPLPAGQSAVVHRGEVVAAGGFISARLTLQDLFEAVLPMTSLASIVWLAQQAGPAGVAAALAEAEPAAQTIDPQTSAERQREHNRHMVWFVRLVDAVLAGGTRRRSNAALPGRARGVIDLVTRAVIVRALTQLPDSPDSRAVDRRRRFPIVSVTTNRAAAPAVTRSRMTIKADAAEQVFSVDCSSIGWAVVDSGIDAYHPAFAEWWEAASGPQRGPVPRVVRAFNFVGVRGALAADALDNGLVDWARALPYVEIDVPQRDPRPSTSPVPLVTYSVPTDAHGTHVAGIIGGHWPERRFRGICPDIKLYDFRVLDGQGRGDEFAIVTALQAIRHINDQAGRLVIAGVNLSLSVPHDVATHSCGWTPVCVECDRLTRSGVVVVAAAGNAGYTGVTRTTGVGYHTVSISDPGNTDAVITVGSTHRSDPHRHGVSYFSSRGPTADGRAKPDLIAPGEDIDGPVPGEGIAAMHGTSQAAAHVSGAAAMLVARHRELLGRPERVKEILCGTATDLGRERGFQGNGLVDVLRAMQSV